MSNMLLGFLFGNFLLTMCDDRKAGPKEHCKLMGTLSAEYHANWELIKENDCLSPIVTQQHYNACKPLFALSSALYDDLEAARSALNPNEFCPEEK